ncbi:hypothetical protein KY386_02650 [Candidatus Parcubacteria bacterium]|nr:hypothetical protein [Candidatus Parcubacteria bacterium]
MMQEVAALFDKHGLALTNFQSEGSYVYFEASTPDGDITAELTFRRTEGAEGSEPGVQPGQPEETGEQE